MTSAVAKNADLKADLDLEWLLKVRTVVARIGEMDLARWWNSNGQLGPQGASVLRRGLPRTYHFAQARSVCMVAAARCAQIFDPPGSVTLWRLTDPLEERLETLWEGWLDDAKSWRQFFERVALVVDLTGRVGGGRHLLRHWFRIFWWHHRIKFNDREVILLRVRANEEKYPVISVHVL